MSSSFPKKTVLDGVDATAWTKILAFSLLSAKRSQYPGLAVAIMMVSDGYAIHVTTYCEAQATDLVWVCQTGTPTISTYEDIRDIPNQPCNAGHSSQLSVMVRLYIVKKDCVYTTFVATLWYGLCNVLFSLLVVDIIPLKNQMMSITKL